MIFTQNCHKILGLSNMWALYISALIGAASAAVQAPSYGYAPEYYCRDTNTSVYAEVCVPAFTEKVTPVTLAVKEVVDNDYCFDRVLTVCEETSTTVEREICTMCMKRRRLLLPAPPSRLLMTRSLKL